MKIQIIPKRKMNPSNAPYADTGAYFLNVVESQLAKTVPSVGAVLNSPTIQGTLAAPSGWAIPSVTLSGDITPGGTGVKIGTAPTQLLAFYNANPVDQPELVNLPAGGTTVDSEARTAITDLVSRIQEVGLMKLV